MALVVLPAASACAKFATHNAFTNNPWAYDDVFIDVATRALIQHQTGKVFEDAVGPIRWRQGRPGDFYSPCAGAVAVTALLTDPAGCRLARYIDEGRHCANRDGCGELLFDPELLKQPATRAILVNAIAEPCAAITPPQPVRNAAKDAKPKPLQGENFRFRGLAYSATEAWRLLRCGEKRPVQGRVERLDPDTGSVSFRFD
jgi:hypothetical protein